MCDNEIFFYTICFANISLFFVNCWCYFGITRNDKILKGHILSLEFYMDENGIPYEKSGIKLD